MGLLESLRTTYSKLSLYEDEGTCTVFDSSSETRVCIAFKTVFTREPYSLRLEWDESRDLPNAFAIDNEGITLLKNRSVVKRLDSRKAGGQLMNRTFDISCFLCSLFATQLRPCYLLGKESAEAVEPEEVGGEACFGAMTTVGSGSLKIFVSKETNLLRAVRYTHLFSVDKVSALAKSDSTRELIERDLRNPLKRELLFAPTRWV